MGNKTKVIILIGPPGCGKSTAAKEFIKLNPSYVRVNRDDLRMMLRNEQMLDNKSEEILTDIQNNIIINFLSRGKNVIIDNTNLKEKYLKELINVCSDYCDDIIFNIFDTKIETCIERNNNREQKVPIDVIKKMFIDFENLKNNFEFHNYRKYIDKPFEYNQKNSNSLPECYLFDIDGTLALMNGKRGPFDWNKVHLDDVNEIVKEQLILLHKNNYKIIIMTGRDESCKELTKNWFNVNNIPFDDMFMRTKDDHRKDSVIKTELFEKHIKGNYFVKGVFDDRLQVIDTWYKLGIFTFNVNQGNKLF
jgi:predicted kinase